jgi:hypothetical protein
MLLRVRMIAGSPRMAMVLSDGAPGGGAQLRRAAYHAIPRADQLRTLFNTLKALLKIGRSYSATTAQIEVWAWIISRISQTHLAHWALQPWRWKTSRGRRAPASMAAATSRWRMPLQLQTYTGDPEADANASPYHSRPGLQRVLSLVRRLLAPER